MSSYWDDKWKNPEHYGRLICPMCQNSDPKKIRQEDDLKHPLYYHRNGQKPMYAKKNVCTDCKYEW